MLPLMNVRHRLIIMVFIVVILPCCVLAQTTTTNSTTTTVPMPKVRTEMSWQSYYTLAVCGCIFLFLGLDMAPCSAVMVASTVALRVSGIITNHEAIAGLSNTSVVTVQMLAILIAPIGNLPALKRMIRQYLGREQGVRGLSMLRLKVVGLAMATSWFVGNLPVTVMMTPLLKQYCIDTDIPASQLLMPMDIATLIGGTFSTIGVSTNLMVSGMMEQAFLGPLPFFEMAKTSLVPGVVALIYLTFAARWLLPSNANGLVQHFQEKSTSFLIQFRILHSSPLAGVRVGDVDSSLPVMVRGKVELVRMVQISDNLSLSPPPEHVVMNSGDSLTFCGDIVLLRQFSQLLHLEWLPLKDEQFDPRESVKNRSFRQQSCIQHADGSDSRFVEVVIDTGSPCIGLPASHLRRRYGVALLGLRSQQRNIQQEEIGTWLLRGGDTALVVGPVAGLERHQSEFLVITVLDGDDAADHKIDRHFWIIPNAFQCIGTTILPEAPKPQMRRTVRISTSNGDDLVELPNKSLLEGESIALLPKCEEEKKEKKITVRIFWLPEWFPYLSIVVFAACIGCSIYGLNIMDCLLVGTFVSVSLKLCTLQEALKALKLEIYIIMALSFGLGSAMTKSGLAQIVGERIIDAGLTGLPLLIFISFITTILANVISSKACIQVLFPVVVTVFKEQGTDPMPGVVVLACSTVASLAMPFAHATHLLVMGPGGYQSKDFFKYGVPLNFLTAISYALMAFIVYK